MSTSYICYWVLWLTCALSATSAASVKNVTSLSSVASAAGVASVKTTAALPACTSSACLFHNVSLAEDHPEQQHQLQDGVLYVSTYDNGIVRVRCEGGVGLEDAWRPQLAAPVQELRVQGCALPVREGYAAVLAARGFHVDSLRRLDVHLPPALAPVRLRADHLSGLRNLHALRVTADPSTMFHTHAALVATLPNITYLELEGVELEDGWPESERLETVVLRRGALAAGAGAAAWRRCPTLYRIQLSEWSVGALQADWAGACEQLCNLRLERVRRAHAGDTLPPRLAGAAAELRHLSAVECALTHVPRDLIADAKLLDTLDLSGNQLRRLPSDIFSTAQSLRELNLSRNLLTRDELLPVLAPLGSLESLDVDNNMLGNICEAPVNFGHHEYRWLEHVVRLSARGTGATRLCGSWWQRNALSLKQLSLPDNNIAKIEYKELGAVREGGWRVDLRGNPVSAVLYDSGDFDDVLRDFPQSQIGSEWRGEVLIDSQLNCDCQLLWFSRALRQRPAHAPALPELRCADGALFTDVPPDIMTVCWQQPHDCPRYCTCRWNHVDYTTTANCTGSQLRHVPRLHRLRDLHALNNRIETIGLSEVSSTLKLLDLRHNNVSRIDEKAVAALFSSPERRLRLAGNPIVCLCDNLPLLAALQKYQRQVVDYSAVRCADGRLVRDVQTAALCAAGGAVVAGAVVAACGLLALLAGLALALFYRYEREAKIFLFRHGCCLRAEEPDRDRPYDAFVSFSHHDEDFVSRELVPRLEVEHGFRLCLHSRDWVVGEWIPTQITRSVELSRRTLVVLSRNFLESTWARAEFRTAHAAALRDVHPRLIVVLLEPLSALPADAMDAELTAYLATNTYVTRSDPMFWDKLLYALPHRLHHADGYTFSSTDLSTKVQSNIGHHDSKCSTKLITGQFRLMEKLFYLK